MYMVILALLLGYGASQNIYNHNSVELVADSSIELPNKEIPPMSQASVLAATQQNSVFTCEEGFKLMSNETAAWCEEVKRVECFWDEELSKDGSRCQKKDRLKIWQFSDTPNPSTDPTIHQAKAWCWPGSEP